MRKAHIDKIKSLLFGAECKEQEIEADLCCVVPNEPRTHKYEVRAYQKGAEITLYQGNDLDRSFDIFEKAHKRYPSLHWSINHEQE